MTDGKRSHLGFGSVVHNYGDGPLRIDGSRASRSQRFMVADQVIARDDGSSVRVPGVGRLRYVDSVTHRHWHYLRFDTYSLRRTNGKRVRRDRKTGFCLGDRLESPSIGPLPAQPPTPEYPYTNCGYDRPGLLRLTEGISVGYGDDYSPQLEGQYVDLTGLRAGRYMLVHVANADGAVREKSRADNAASVLIDLRWRRGRVPRVRQLARCPLRARCPVPRGRPRRVPVERTTRFAPRLARVGYCPLTARG